QAGRKKTYCPWVLIIPRLDDSCYSHRDSRLIRHKIRIEGGVMHCWPADKTAFVASDDVDVDVDESIDISDDDVFGKSPEENAAANIAKDRPCDDE
ncbi:hypothetical protein PMAYCL1PPCAC_04405, partial [Pristionchus mayeri]